MPNYIWFFLLIILAAGLFLYILSKKNKAKVFSVYFYISGLSYIFDYIVLVLGDAYEYHPHFLKEKWFDYFYGSSVSQAMAVPMVAVLLATFNLSVKWYFLFALMFIVIEWVFVQFGLYVQNWWHYSYTFLFLLASFLATLKWVTMLDRPNKFVKFFTMFLCIVFIEDTLTFYQVALFHTYLYMPGWFSDTIRDHIAGNTIATFTLSLVVTSGLVLHFRWFGFGLILVCNCLIDSLLIHLGYLRIAEFWNLSYCISIEAVMIFIYRWIYHRLFYKSPYTRKIKLQKRSSDI